MNSKKSNLNVEDDTLAAQQLETIECKKIMETLKKSQETYHNLFNNSEVGMFRTRFDGSELLNVNEKCLEIFGWDREEVIGKPTRMHWVDPNQRIELLRKLKVNNRVVDFECKLLNKKKEERDCLLSMNIYPTEGVLDGSVIDITERKLAEKALKESEEKYRNLIVTTSEGFWLLDSDKKTIDVNQSLCDMLGYSRIEIIGKTPFDFVDDENLKIFKEHALQITSILHRTYEIMLKKKNGINFPTIFNSTSLIDKNGKPTGAFAFVTDITERKLSEFAINERLKELNCFYGISQIMETPDISIEEILRKVIKLVPTSWQYPEITVCRIIVDGIEYKEPNFKKTNWVQGSDIKVANKNVGIIEIYNLVKMPDRDEGPFLKEERMLLDAIAERMGQIVEIKQTEEALKESEEKYRNLIVTTSEGFWLLDSDKKTIDVNQSLCDMLGYSRIEMIGKTPFDFVNDENLKIFKEQTSQITSTLHRTYEIALIKKSGINFPTIFNATSLIDKNGKSAGSFAFVTDITNRKQTEEALKESEKKYRTLSYNIPGMIYQAGTDWSTQVITNLEEVCGYSIDEWDHQKMNWTNLIHPDDKQGVIEGASKLLIKPISIIQEYRIISKDGKIRWVSDHKTSFFKDDGSFDGFYGIVFDITQRKLAEEALNESEEKYRK